MNQVTDTSRGGHLEAPENVVSIDQRRVHPRHEKLLNRFVRRAIPFAFGFFHIQTEFKLSVDFVPLARGVRGTFGLPRYNSHRELVIRISNNSRDMPHLFSTFFHEMTHFHQFLHDDLNPRAPGYFSQGRILREAYLSDRYEIEARETAVIMEDSFRRYANNYRWNVPCEILLQKNDRSMKIVNPEAPTQAT